MADKITLNAKLRSVTGKKVRAMRTEGRMPIVLYGAGTEPVTLEVATKEFGQVAHSAGTTQLISVVVEGEMKPRPVLIRDVQQHVTRLTPIHADLIQVDLTQTIRAVVQVVISVMPRIAETGAAVASMQTTELTVEALPESLPQQIEVDASGLVEFDSSIKAGEVDLGPGVTLIDDPETVLIALSRPRAAVVADEEAGELEEGAEAGGAEAEGEGDSVED